jgi:hypothetical protein
MDAEDGRAGELRPGARLDRQLLLLQMIFGAGSAHGLFGDGISTSRSSSIRKTCALSSAFDRRIRALGVKRKILDEFMRTLGDRRLH